MSRDPSPAQTSTLFRNGLLFDGTGAAGEVLPGADLVLGLEILSHFRG